MKKVIEFLVLVGFLCLTINLLKAQSRISGLVMDPSGQMMPRANAFLLNAADSSFVRGAVVDDNGRYLFEKVVAGPYLIKVTMIGFNTAYTTEFHLKTSDKEHELEPIQLDEGVTLEGIIVTAEKPVYEAKIDRLTINVENIGLFAGTTALDILERSPGIVLDRQNGNISLLGKDNINVKINGKMQYMPLSALLQFLDGISSDNVEKIELITMPPAQEDAGSDGFINIVLKKHMDEGLNGSFSLSQGYGRGHVTNNNLNLNFRKNKVHLFGSYSFLRNSREQNVSTLRAIRTAEGLFESNTNAQRSPTQRNHNLRLGLDYQLSDKTEVAGLFSAYNNKWLQKGPSINDLLNDGVLSLSNAVDITERNLWQHYGLNFNLRHQFTSKEFLSIDLDYLNYQNENPTDYLNTVSDGSQNLLEETLTQSAKVTPLDIMVGKLDYHKELSDGLKFDAGVKVVRSSFDNAVLVQTLEADTWIPDPSLTSNSTLAEQILAAYTSADLKLGEKTSAKLGLRYEYTDSKLDSDSEGRIVDRQFGKLFPSVFLAHSFSKTTSTNLSYSRRINRPTFREMAPFVFLLDPTTFFAGNAAIQPAISDVVKLDLRYKTLFLSVQYTVQDSAIARFQQRYDPETERLLLVSENLKNAKILSFTLGFPFKITKWWNTRTNAIFFRQENNSYISDRPVQLKRSYAQFNTSHSFKLPKGFTSEVALFYTGPRLWGALDISEVYGLNLGLQKRLTDPNNKEKNWGTLRLNVSDVLNSVVLRGQADVPDQNLSYKGNFDFSQRTYTLSYSRNFGNQKLKAGRKRQRGGAEETGRMKG